MRISDAKKWLRSYARRHRRNLSPVDRHRKSQKIVARFLASSLYKKARALAVYMDFGSEVQTRRLIERAWHDGKIVLIPNTSRGLHRPFFQVYRRGDVLHKTKFGPMELGPSQPAFAPEDVNVVVVPGLAFDGRGHRLGYGGGTYDRILTKTRRAKHIGLFFFRQKMAHLPSEKHDFKLNAILTD